MKIAALAAAALTLLFASADCAAEWVTCAKEDGFCRFDGKREVAYGSGEKWSVKWATNGVKCANSVFGDPAPQKAKTCRVRVAAGQPAFSEKNASWPRCATEGQDCRFDGTRKVAYGAGNRWHYRVARDKISCTSGIFGGDPAPNVVKACFLDPR